MDVFALWYQSDTFRSHRFEFYSDYGGRECDCGEGIKDWRRGTGLGATPVAISVDDVSLLVKEGKFAKDSVLALRACLLGGIDVVLLLLK